MGKLFSTLSLPEPDTIASLIAEAALPDAPKAIYSKGPDDTFDSFLSEKTGLKGLKV